MCRSPGCRSSATDVHVRTDRRNLRLDLRLDAANHGGAQILAAAEHALQIEVRRNLYDVRARHAAASNSQSRMRSGAGDRACDEAQQPPPHLRRGRS